MSDGGLTPVEVYLLFPVAGGADAVDAMKDEAMTALASAVRKYWTGRFDYADRSGSATAGFGLSGAGRRLWVVRAVDTPYLDGSRAVEVRAEWR